MILPRDRWGSTHPGHHSRGVVQQTTQTQPVCPRVLPSAFTQCYSARFTSSSQPPYSALHPAGCICPSNQHNRARQDQAATQRMHDRTPPCHSRAMLCPTVVGCKDQKTTSTTTTTATAHHNQQVGGVATHGGFIHERGFDRPVNSGASSHAPGTVPGKAWTGETWSGSAAGRLFVAPQCRRPWQGSCQEAGSCMPAGIMREKKEAGTDWEGPQSPGHCLGPEDTGACVPASEHPEAPLLMDHQQPRSHHQ